MAKKSIKLYSYRRCPFAMRVRFTLHEKNIPFEVQEEDLSNFSDELKALHPEAKVPLLVHGSLVLYESAIITEYIDEAFPESVKLMPSDAAGKAEVRLWTYWCNQIFKRDLDRFKYGTSRFPENECVGSEAKVISHLEKIERRLKDHPWLVGDQFSLADIHVFPFFRQLSRVQPTPAFLSRYPATLKWIETISTRPSFVATMKQ
jgi:glutathione S-transferase